MIRRVAIRTGLPHDGRAVVTPATVLLFVNGKTSEAIKDCNDPDLRTLANVVSIKVDDCANIFALPIFYENIKRIF